MLNSYGFMYRGWRRGWRGMYRPYGWGPGWGRGWRWYGRRGCCCGLLALPMILLPFLAIALFATHWI